jgi:hypothetical protein
LSIPEQHYLISCTYVGQSVSWSSSRIRGHMRDGQSSDVIAFVISLLHSQTNSMCSFLSVTDNKHHHYKIQRLFAWWMYNMLRIYVENKNKIFILMIII